MIITQTVTGDDFRQAYLTFYSTNLFTRFRPWFGAVMLAFGMYLVTSPSQRQPLAVALLFILLGVYLFMDKRLYVSRRLLQAKRAGRLPATMQVELSSGGMLKVSGDGEHNELDLRKVYGYQVTPMGVLIYLHRSLFFVLKRDAVEQAGGLDMLLSILGGSGLRKIR